MGEIALTIMELNIHRKFDVITAIQALHYFHEKDRLHILKKCYEALHTASWKKYGRMRTADRPLWKKLLSNDAIDAFGYDETLRFSASRNSVGFQYASRYNRNKVISNNVFEMSIL